MKTRIKELIIKGVSKFYPQYEDVIGYSTYKKYDKTDNSHTVPIKPIRRSISFNSIKDARAFIQEKIDSIPVVKYHDEIDHEV